MSKPSPTMRTLLHGSPAAGLLQEARLGVMTASASPPLQMLQYFQNSVVSTQIEIAMENALISYFYIYFVPYSLYLLHVHFPCSFSSTPETFPGMEGDSFLTIVVFVEVVCWCGCAPRGVLWCQCPSVNCLSGQKKKSLSRNETNSIYLFVYFENASLQNLDLHVSYSIMKYIYIFLFSVGSNVNAGTKEILNIMFFIVFCPRS